MGGIAMSNLWTSYSFEWIIDLFYKWSDSQIQLTDSVTAVNKSLEGEDYQ